MVAATPPDLIIGVCEEALLATTEFPTPGKILFGVGALESLGQETRRLGRQALLVTGRRAMAEAGITERCLALLSAAGADAALFDLVESEPDVTTVDSCRKSVREHQAEVVIGQGGGTASRTFRLMRQQAAPKSLSSPDRTLLITTL
jgi:alcohol dehydrogenase class IV